MNAEAETPGELAVAEALRLWRLDVYDPKRSDKSDDAEHSRNVISGIVEAAGWTWKVPYLGDGHVEWCGMFAAACWRKAGIDPKWLATYWASTYRLDAWANYRDFGKVKNPRPAQGPHRRIVELGPNAVDLPWAPEMGDILTIGDGVPPMGDHICLVVSYDPVRRVFATVEGNGHGVGPDGRRRQGIVRAERKLGGEGYCARRLIRPALADML
jgi:hypothetical protein